MKRLGTWLLILAMILGMTPLAAADTTVIEPNMELELDEAITEAIPRFNPEIDGIDPLTGLPNRRSMIERIERFYKESGDQPFSIAIADLDYFKKVNDTYGHNTGDYTLVRLTELFAEHSMGRYNVCRWGGEEFCFFMPGMNLDEAGTLMNDLCFAVEKLKLEHEGKEFSITITIGVEENDFSSPLEDLLNSADEKLYMGKEAGRNRVVV